MSELTDLNATGNGLAAVSGGLQGLLEAYKMKMAQQVEQAKVNQQGLDAGAAARAQAQMMMPFRQAQLDQAAAALAEKARNDQQARDTAQQVADQQARTANPTGAAVTSPDGKMYWNGKNWAPMSASSVIPLKDQLAAKTMIDNLENMKNQVPNLGLSDEPGVGATLASAASYANSKIGGTAQNVFVNRSMPDMMAEAHDVAGRFSMSELPVMANGIGFNNTNSSLVGNINAMQDKLREKANLNGYVAGSAAPGGTTQAAPGAGAPPPAPGPVAPAAPTAPATPAPSIIQRLTSLASPGASPAPASPGGSLPTGAAPASYSQTGTHSDGSKWGLNTAKNQWEQIAPAPAMAAAQ